MKWFKYLSREYGVMYMEIALRSVSDEVKHISPFWLRHTLAIPDGNNEAFYMDEEEWKKANVKLFSSICKNKKIFARFAGELHAIGKKYMTVSKKLSGRNLKKINDAQLKREYENYVLLWRDYTAYLWIGFDMNEYVSKSAKDIVLSHLKETGSEEMFFDLINAIFSPPRKAGIFMLQDRLRVLKKKGYSKKDIEEITNEYAWLTCLDVHNEPWTSEDAAGYIEHFNPEQKKFAHYSKLIKDVELSRREKELIEIANQFTYIKDMRDEYRRRSVYAIRPFFSEIARRMKLSLHDFSYITAAEVFTQMSKTEIMKRKKGYMMYMEKGKIVCISDKKTIERRMKDVLGSSVSAVEEVQGLAASKGKAKGVVRLVLGIADLKKVKKGDILVGIVTHPDFVPTMHKAAAIVTDEGGLSSHAAIVSREMGIPCIVGTKKATSIFKDGDIVEVDAEKGIVRKVK